MAISPSDAWAVGGRGGQANQALLTHWNGFAWSVASTPGPGVGQELLGLGAAGPNDVWAVGYEEPDGGGPEVPLTEHWGGTAWSVVASPDPGPGSRLTGVAVLSANDAWAVGSQARPTSSSGGPSSTQAPQMPGAQPGSAAAVIEHWDGHSWSVVASPDPSGGYQALYGVAATGPGDVWAVGGGVNGQAVAEHWDGKAWSIVPAGTGQLNAVAALSGQGVWAVGVSGPKTLIERWDGRSWSLVASPDPSGFQSDDLKDIAVVSASDAWAVGESYGSSSGNYTLVAHWDGSAWSVVPSPSPDADDLLGGVSADGVGDVWAVGVAGWTPGAVEPSPGALAEQHCRD